jgi:hypothetical protein
MQLEDSDNKDTHYRQRQPKHKRNNTYIAAIILLAFTLIGYTYTHDIQLSNRISALANLTYQQAQTAPPATTYNPSSYGGSGQGDPIWASNIWGSIAYVDQPNLFTNMNNFTNITNITTLIVVNNISGYMKYDSWNATNATYDALLHPAYDFCIEEVSDGNSGSILRKCI